MSKLTSMEEPILCAIPEAVANLQLPDPALLSYYQDSSDRIYFLEEVINEDTLELIKIIMRCNSKDVGLPVTDRVPIKIFINSLGGDVQIMWSIINAIKMSITPVHTIVFSTAMSAAAHILAAGHKRFAFPGATILVHSGSAEYYGDVEKVESAKKYYDALSKKANNCFIESTHIIAKDLKKKGSSDWYMDAEDALRYGVVDCIPKSFDEVFGS